MDSNREVGQVLPLALGGAFVLLAGALVLVAIAGAITGVGRAQRAADLVAVSAARSMRDDLDRLLSPPRLPDGSPDPRHLEKAAYLLRARLAGTRAAKANSVAQSRLRLSFPDRDSFAPLRVKAVIVAEVEVGEQGSRLEASATAEAAAPATSAGESAPTMASGGGYSGPLVYRQGQAWA